MAINTMRKFTSKLVVFVIFSVILITVIKKYKANQKNYYHLSMKYILLWTSEKTIPFLHIGQGRRGFISRNCAYTNCFVTSNKSLLGNTTAFDAILFHGPELIYRSDLTFPEERLPHQKYVFTSIESPANYPLCYHNFNGYFNWTWTYKLDSDIRWGFIVVKDSNGTIVGPKKDMHWIEWKDMDPVNETFKYQLRSKHSAVAWFVSNCQTQSKRELYVKRLKAELSDKYERDIHVYGDCGMFTCNREKQDCDQLLKRDYFFYLSFENALSEDYVTEKLMHAVQNNVVPIVYGGANYSRFLPHRSYLNAREYKISELARLIDQLIREPLTYAEFFRWKKYYSYHRTINLEETNEYCKMCAALNDETLMKTTSVCNEFSDFWEVNKTC